jgi:hypothetical protein
MWGMPGGGRRAALIAVAHSSGGSPSRAHPAAPSLPTLPPLPFLPLSAVGVVAVVAVYISGTHSNGGTPSACASI